MRIDGARRADSCGAAPDGLPQLRQLLHRLRQQRQEQAERGPRGRAAGEIDATSALVGTRPLQPTKKYLGNSRSDV
jgi:hypothetical protein